MAALVCRAPPGLVVVAGVLVAVCVGVTMTTLTMVVGDPSIVVVLREVEKLVPCSRVGVLVSLVVVGALVEVVAVVSLVLVVEVVGGSVDVVEVLSSVEEVVVVGVGVGVEVLVGVVVVGVAVLEVDCVVVGVDDVVVTDEVSLLVVVGPVVVVEDSVELLFWRLANSTCWNFPGPSYLWSSAWSASGRTSRASSKMFFSGSARTAGDSSKSTQARIEVVRAIIVRYLAMLRWFFVLFVKDFMGGKKVESLVVRTRGCAASRLFLNNKHSPAQPLLFFLLQRYSARPTGGSAGRLRMGRIGKQARQAKVSGGGAG